MRATFAACSSPAQEGVGGRCVLCQAGRTTASRLHASAHPSGSQAHNPCHFRRHLQLRLQLKRLVVYAHSPGVTPVAGMAGVHCVQGGGVGRVAARGERQPRRGRQRRGRGRDEDVRCPLPCNLLHGRASGFCQLEPHLSSTQRQPRWVGSTGSTTLPRRTSVSRSGSCRAESMASIVCDCTCDYGGSEGTSEVWWRQGTASPLTSGSRQPQANSPFGSSHRQVLAWLAA